jgi:hypothetical protein
MKINLDGPDLLTVFRLPALIDLNESDKLFAFLFGLRAGSSEDMKVLDSWSAYFREINVPFAILKDGKFRELWKELKSDE